MRIGLVFIVASAVLAETDIRSSKDVVPPVEETIKNMYCNRRYVLSCYRSLEHKMQLLNAAVDTFDGNIILTVRVENNLVLLF